MIALEDATLSGGLGPRRRGATKASRLALGPMSLELGPGAHAFVGPSADGGPLLLAVLAGAERLRSGRALVLGAAAAPRPDVAWVPVVPELPRALTSIEVLTLGARLRGTAVGVDAGDPPPAPAARLETFGLSMLGRRRVATLSTRELHSVALVEALTSSAPVLLLDEPLGHIDARALGAIVRAIKQRASDGTCIVIATASARDAAALGASTWIVRGGLCVKQDGARAGADALSRIRGMRVIGRDLAPLAAALAADPRARDVDWEGADLVVRGDEAIALATAVGASIAASGAIVDWLEPFESQSKPARARTS